MNARPGARHRDTSRTGMPGPTLKRCHPLKNTSARNNAKRWNCSPAVPPTATPKGDCSPMASASTGRPSPRGARHGATRDREGGRPTD
jgi:hypothetical protein